LNSGEIAAITGIYRAQLASLLAVDDLVERLVVALEETGELDNTVILYTSDNGFFRGEHRIPDGKFFPYEEAIRVPLIIRGGGFPAGHTALQPAANVDLAATLVALAGARAGRTLDGRPLLPLALDSNLAQDRSILIEGFNDTLSRPGFRGVRTSRYLYLEYQTGEQELYDLEKDPLQLDSRHAVPRWANLRADLAARVERLRDCAGATCRF
jgi:arylsulfatase A-like enzyme